MSIAAAIRGMLDAGLTIEQALIAVEQIEAAKPVKRSAAAERQARYRERKNASRVTSQASHNVTTVTCDDIAPEHAPAELEPKTLENSYLKTPLKGVKKGEVLTSIAKPKSANAECLTELGKVLDESHAQAVIDHRNRMRKPMTPYAASRLALSLAQAPDPNAAADEMIERGWQGWKPDWGRGQGPPGRVRENSLLNGIEEIEQRFGSSNVQQFPRITG
jgi:hypothetical protein